ncbi:cytochrome c oxidase subunit II [Aliihoeflea sp. PC F10.4]
MTGDGDGGGDLLLGHFLDDGIAPVARLAHAKSLVPASTETILPRSAKPDSRARARAVEWRIAPLVALTPLAACSGPLSTLDPAGPAASNIAILWWIMFWGSAVLFVLVMGLFAWAFWRPGALARFSLGQWVVGGGLIMPVIVLIALVTSAFVLGERLIPKPMENQPLRVHAMAHQWNWQFGYDDAEGQTLQLHIPAGTPVDVVVTTSDVIHSFWVPRLAGKIDAIPGHENVLRIEADRPGTYRGVCAEFCGDGHTRMRFTVIAHEPEQYEAARAAAIARAGR